MAKIIGSFTNTFRKLEKAVEKSSNQALLRAGTSTRARYAKEISAELGITSARAKTRAKIIKQSRQDIALSIGVRTQFAAHDFKPKSIKVISRLGPRYGATFQVKGAARVTTERGFLAYGKAGAKKAKHLIIERIGKERYGTRTVMVDVFKPAVQRLAPTLQKHMLETFKKNLDERLRYNIDKI